MQAEQVQAALGDQLVEHEVGVVAVVKARPEVDLPPHRPARALVTPVAKGLTGRRQQVRRVPGDLVAGMQAPQVRDVPVFVGGIVLVVQPFLQLAVLPDLVGRDTRIIAPAGARTYLRRRGFKNVTEIGREEQIYIKGVRIMATQADHAGDRPPFGPKLDSVGYMIEGDYQVYFAGDTDHIPEMADIACDVVLLPIGGTYTMDVEEATQAVSEDGAEVSLDIM